MNRNISIILVLLFTLSIVNAIPHQLHKRITAFGSCGIGNVLDVAVSPDPLIPGKTAQFSVSGPLTPPAKTGSTLGIGFFAAGADDPIAPPLYLDLCEIQSCPISYFDASGPVEVPAKLPKAYDIVVAIFDPAGEIIACAGAIVGGSSAKAPYLQYSIASGPSTWAV